MEIGYKGKKKSRNGGKAGGSTIPTLRPRDGRRGIIKGLSKYDLSLLRKGEKS